MSTTDYSAAAAPLLLLRLFGSYVRANAQVLSRNARLACRDLESLATAAAAALSDPNNNGNHHAQDTSTMKISEI